MFRSQCSNLFASGDTIRQFVSQQELVGVTHFYASALAQICACIR